MIAHCTHKDCPRTHAAGFKLYRTRDGWRCVEHAEQTTGRNKSAQLRRALTEREARADTEKRSTS